MLRQYHLFALNNTASRPMPSTATPTVSAWLDRHLGAHPPRAKSLVMTLFGDIIIPHGGSVWMGSLIELMAPFGISDRLVRTSVFRLAEEGWLDAQREGRRSRYTLDPRSSARFERAYQRVYTQAGQDWDGQWTLVLAHGASITSEQRAMLRKELGWQGFGQVAPLVLAHPVPDLDILDDVLRRSGARDGVFVCAAREPLQATAARPLADLVAQCWELASVVADYQRFIAEFGQVADLLDAPGSTLDPRDAFMLRALTIHAYRRTKLHDPQLPLALLPADWPGTPAFALCRRIYRAVQAGAEAHVLALLRREDPAAPGAAPYFYQRFDGLD